MTAGTDFQSINGQYAGQIKYRPDIDGLRAVAILAVVAFHAFPDAFPGGFVGVDIFFVISGFLISRIILDHLECSHFSIADFYGRRVRRIFPALILVLFSTYLFGWFFLLADEYQQLGKHIAAGAAFVSNIVLWQESGYFDNAAASKPLLHLWSLGIEEQFYIVWPLLLLIASRYRRLMLAIAVVWVASFIANIVMTRQDSIDAFYLPVSRMWELATGGIVGSVIRSHSVISRWRIESLAVTGLLLLVAAFVLVRDGHSFPGWSALLPTAGAALLIIAGPQAAINKHVLSSRLMLLVGLISYPLYLWHWPLLSYAHILFRDVPPLSVRLLCVMLAMVLAALTFKLLEQPLRAAALKSQKKVLFLSSAMLAMGLLGWLTFAWSGLGFRAAADTHVATTAHPVAPTSAGAALAGSVTPQPAEATTAGNRFDRPYKQSCAFLLGEDSGNDWCNIGNTTRKNPNVLILGDSTANADTTIFDALTHTKEFRHLVWRQYGQGQCPMLLNYGPESCQKITRAALAYIAKTPSIKTIIMIGDWPAYAHDRPFFHDTRIEKREAFWNDFHRTVDYYLAHGKNVGVMLAPPVSSTDPKSCLGRTGGSLGVQHCHIELKEALLRDEDYRPLMEAYLQTKSIKVFDPLKYLCDGSQCRMMDGDRILYNDGPHISAFGGAYLAEQGKADLRQLLKESQ